MKRVCFLVLCACAVGCGGNSSGPVEGPSSSPPHAPKVTSGTFAVTSEVSYDGCAQPTEWAGDYDLEVDSLTFSMGPFDGDWDASHAKALGETEHHQTIYRLCTVTTWNAIDLTFTSEDAFYGHIIYYSRPGANCGSRTSCASTWLIHGTRQPPPSP